jgi:hypothetical protein
VRKGYGKPNGFWVSDDSDHGWADWCLAEEFRLDGLRYRHRVTLSESANILGIHNGEQLEVFHEIYSVEDEFSRSFNRSYDYHDKKHYWPINWHAVAEKYDGIIITPYLWSHRLDGPSWYYGWDCASGCIWNLAAIESVTAAPLKELTP